LLRADLATFQNYPVIQTGCSKAQRLFLCSLKQHCCAWRFLGYARSSFCYESC